MIKKQKHTMISLFSGIGGLDLGLHESGFQPLFCSEIDTHAGATLKQWLARTKLDCVFAPDVTGVGPSDLMRHLGLSPGELDLLAGGPPCQSFSLIGKRGSLVDKRGLLVFEMPRYARVFLPKVILMEQVRGLISAPCLKRERGGVLRLLMDELEELGYKVSYKLLRAADYGVPQIRDRVFLVASREKPFMFPSPTHFPANDDGNSSGDLFGETQKRYLTVKEAIGDLPEPVLKGGPEKIPNHVDVTPARDRERIKGVPEGDYLARQFHLPIEQRCRLDPTKDTTKFRRLAWNEPSLTLRGGEAFYHPSQDRYLTPRECLRLHGFNDNHVLIGPIRGRSGTVRDLDQHRLVANAVPPPIANVIGKEIVSQFLS